MSEYAFWKNAQQVYGSLMQSVPDTPNSMVIIESTANGYNDFKDKWDLAVAGKSDFKPLFFAWYEMESYRKPYHGEELTPDEIELKKQFNLDNEQIMWRRHKIVNDCNNDIDLFHQEYPSTPEEAFLFSGSSYFKMDNIKKAKERKVQPISIGHFEFDSVGAGVPTNIRYVETNDKNDFVYIYKKPVDRRPYVIGGDTAGEGSDNFIDQALDNINGEQVAKLKYSGADELLYAQQTYCLGKYYNEALIALETNFSTYPQRKLEEWRYPAMYVREKFDEFTHNLKNSYGFRTTASTRPTILANLQSIIKDCWELIVDYETLTECETFAKNEDGRAEAMDGKHDDHVMSLAIAYHARNQQRFDLYESNEVQKKSELPSWFNKEDDYYEGEGNYLWN